MNVISRFTGKLLGVLFSSSILFSLLAADKVAPSFEPPGGLAVDSCPLFIVLGFDDNRYVDGMEWVLDLLEGKNNPEGTGNPATFDGQSIKAAFYHISSALDGDDGSLLATWKKAVEKGHEVADHTVTHNTSKSSTLADWESEISDSRTALAEALGLNESEIVGFRTPYLDFNAATFEACANTGLLYECTMTQMQDYNKSQFLWPYTLDEGFPDKVIEGWKGKAIHPGLWELPVYTVGENDLMWPPITGFDSSVLTQANGSKYELMLRNAIAYRMKDGGNRAPLTVGLHSDTYAEANPSGSNYDPQLDLPGRRAALKNFIEYALTIPEVRFVTGVQLIEWMRNPIPLGRVVDETVSETTLIHKVDYSLQVKAGELTLSGIEPGAMVTLFTPSGRVVVQGSLNQRSALALNTLSAGLYLVQIQSLQGVVQTSLIIE